MKNKSIVLSNGHEINYVVASGSLAFDGKGWWWERWLVWFGFIKPKLFTVVLKSLTLKLIKGNLVWWHPWTCVRLLLGGAVNKVGLTNKGVDHWCKYVAPTIDFSNGNIIISLFGEVHEIIEMIIKINKLNLNIAGYEVNVSCPNSGHGLNEADAVIRNVKRIKSITCHPIIVKVSIIQDYLAIAKGLEGIAEAISINSVPWEKVFPGKESPMEPLKTEDERKNSRGGGGVSGKPAQEDNWRAVRNLAEQGSLPVIAPSIMEFDDMEKVRKLGASAVSFGAIHLPDYDWWHFWKSLKKPFTWFTNPCKPTNFVLKEKELCNNIDMLELLRWFDRHLHIRDTDNNMMQTVLPCTINQRATGAVIMPNLPDPITSIEKAFAYRDRIRSVIPEGSDFNPIVPLYLTDDITPEEVVRGFQEGAWSVVKMYMADQNGKGGTTGSAHGVKNLIGRYPVFEAMAQHRIPLLGHFEAVEKDVDEFDREIVSFDRDARPLLQKFSDMPVVFEHITDSRVAEIIADGPYNLYATVTVQHMMYNRNKLFEGGMNSGNWCKPVLKREEHRKKLCEIVTSGNPHFGAGTDSAPHDEKNKSKCYGCAAGIFNAPLAVEAYATIFDNHNALQHLEAFLSKNFLHIYGVKESTEKMVIERTSFVVPEKVGPVQVFMGGQTLPWKLVG